MLDKKFWATALTLSGTMIGAGILGMPYVFSKSGFFIGMFWLVFLGFLILYVNLCLGEITLRTKKIHQLPGYMEKYLGKTGKKIMIFAMFFGIYAALLAYLIGEGQSFSALFFDNSNYSIPFALGFWFVMTLLLREGISGLKKIESFGVVLTGAMIIFLFAFFANDIRIENLRYSNPGSFFVPFGVVLFALLGFSSIPEMRIEILKKEKLFQKAIIFGNLIPMFLYAIFCFAFLGAFGKSVTEVATLSYGSFIPALGIFTMMAAFFVLSISLDNVFKYDLKKKNNSFFFVSLFPLVLYFLTNIFDGVDFVRILGIGGAVSGGMTIVLILFMNMKAKEFGDRKPEYSVPMNWFVFGILSLIFLAGIVLEIGGF